MNAGTLFDYAVLIAALFAVSEGALLSFWKPGILHPLRDMFLWDVTTRSEDGFPIAWTYKSPLHEKGYTFLCLVALFVSGAITMAPALSTFDAFGIFSGGAAYALPFGLAFSYWPGALVTNLLMVAVGELIHDQLSNFEMMPDPADVLPPGVVVETEDLQSYSASAAPMGAMPTGELSGNQEYPAYVEQTTPVEASPYGD